MSGLKYAALLVAVSALVAFVWLLAAPEKHSSLVDDTKLAAPGELIKAQGFHYTEYVDGKIAYQLSGDEIHDEHARIGSLRISVIKVVYVRRPQLNILVGAAKGWVLTAAEGKMVSSRKKLTLTGDIRGKNDNGGTLRANKAMVDMQLGSVQLKDGYEIKTSLRHERGILTSL